MTKLRVLHVLGELRPSGAEVMLQVAAPYFCAENVAGEILSTGEKSLGPFSDTLRNAGYKVHHLPFSRTPSFFQRFRRLVRSERYDIVHFHTERASFWLAFSVVGGKRKLVRTIHSNFQFSGLLRARRMLTRYFSRLLGVTHVSIGPSVQQNESTLFHNPTLLCPNWYNDEVFRPPTAEERYNARKVFNLLDEQTVIATVGNCAPVKNHSVLIEALAQLKERREVIYLHAGAETEEREERKLVEHLGLTEKVHFLGPLNDVRTLLFAADLFAMPSLREGFSLAAIEALGCGLPVLLADVPGLCDLRELFPSLLYAAPSAPIFALQIDDFLSMSTIKRNRFSNKYSAIVRKYFGAKEGVTRYCTLYRNLDKLCFTRDSGRLS